MDYAQVMFERLPLHKEWDPFLRKEFRKRYFEDVFNLLLDDQVTFEILPHKKDRLRVFYQPLSNIKVVIVGQDPSAFGSADGLAFSSRYNKFSREQFAISQELNRSFGAGLASPSLHAWAVQGVFLLNSVLTVRKAKPRSHYHIGWQTLSRNTVNYISRTFKKRKEPVCFMFWGVEARKLKEVVDSEFHLVLESSHPVADAMGATGFVGNYHFSEANEFLTSHGRPEVDWIPGLSGRNKERVAEQKQNNTIVQ